METCLLRCKYTKIKKLIRGAATTIWSYTPNSTNFSLTQELAGTANDVTFALAFNPAGQVISRGNSNTAYIYNQGAEAARAYVPDGLNQYDSVGGTGFTHDARGNLTWDGSLTYAYDPLNRLTSITNGGAVTTLSYDPLGRLRQITSGGTTTDWLWDGDRLVAEYASGGAITARYLHGTGPDEPLAQIQGTRRWFLGDTQGSIIAETDSSGARVGSAITYDPYGQPASWTGPRFGYTGQMRLTNALPLWHYKARVYYPNIRRFLQTDPIGYQDSLNLYQYVGNDPVNGVDPTGMCVKQIDATGDTRASEICRDAGRLNLSFKGAMNIIGFEEYRLTAYDDDGSGTPTIGIGHTAGVEMGDTMSNAEVREAFIADVLHAESIVEELLGDTMVSQEEFDGLVDLAFNVATSTLINGSPGLRSAIEASDYQAMSVQLRYTRARDGSSPRGLVSRSESRRRIFSEGDYSIGINRACSLNLFVAICR